MTKYKFCVIFFASVFLTACAGKLIIDDLSPLYTADPSSDMQITAARQNNCRRLEALPAKRFNRQIRMFADKISHEQNPLVRREYYRELDAYKRLYYAKNYDALRLTDIPLQYRKDEDKTGSGSALLTFSDDRRIATDQVYDVSARCIASAQNMTLTVNGTLADSYQFSDGEDRIRHYHLTVGQELTAGENVLTYTIYRGKRDAYRYTRPLLVTGNQVRTIHPNEADFRVKHTDKTKTYRYDMYDIDLSGADKTIDRYALTNRDRRIIFCNDVSDDRLVMNVIFGQNRVPLYICDSQARNTMTVKWYDNDDIIIEYYTGQQNYTDYLVILSDMTVRASDLMKEYDLHCPVIMNRINDIYILIQYSGRYEPVRIYEFDRTFELLTIRKKKADKYLYKQFGNDEVLSNL